MVSSSIQFNRWNDQFRLNVCLWYRNCCTINLHSLSFSNRITLTKSMFYMRIVTSFIVELLEALHSSIYVKKKKFFFNLSASPFPILVNFMSCFQLIFLVHESTKLISMNHVYVKWEIIFHVSWSVRLWMYTVSIPYTLSYWGIYFIGQRKYRQKKRKTCTYKYIMWLYIHSFRTVYVYIYGEVCKRLCHHDHPATIVSVLPCAMNRFTKLYNKTATFKQVS